MPPRRDVGSNRLWEWMGLESRWKQKQKHPGSTGHGAQRLEIASGPQRRDPVVVAVRGSLCHGTWAWAVDGCST